MKLYLHENKLNFKHNELDFDDMKEKFYDTLNWILKKHYIGFSRNIILEFYDMELVIHDK